MLRLIVTAIIFFFVSRWLARLFPSRQAGSARAAGEPGPSGGVHADSGAGKPRSEAWRAGKAVDADFEDITGT